MIDKKPDGFKSPNKADALNMSFSNLRNHGRGEVDKKDIENRSALYG